LMDFLEITISNVSALKLGIAFVSSEAESNWLRMFDANSEHLINFLYS
jgi:hypothetical protein